MRTIDVINSGIDRHFLRKCINKHIINPIRKDNEWIINKAYIPQEYSEKDVETV